MVSNRPSALTVALFAGGVFSVLVLAVPSAPLFHDDARLRVAFDAIEGTLAATLAYVWCGRLREGWLVRDGALVFTFSVLGATSLSLAVLPQAADHPLLLWTAAMWRLSAAAALALASVSRGRIRSRARFGLGAGAVLCLGAGVGLLARGVDSGLSNLMVGDGVSLSNVRRHALLAAVHTAAMVLYVIAAVCFRQRSRRARDPVLALLSTGACLAAFARLLYVVFPSLYTSLISSGDVLRFAAYLAFGAAGAQEIRNYWASVSAAAVAAERRRAARELHDGLVQELAFIHSRVVDFARASPGSPQLADVAASAGRALAESRELLVVLIGPDDRFSGFDAHLRRAADEVARRHGVLVEVTADVSPNVPAETAHALARVVREAVTNAAVHGRATKVVVEMTEEHDQLVLVICDDGVGFDPSATQPGRFGLISMRERVAGLGGDIDIESSAGAGSRLRLVVPRA